MTMKILVFTEGTVLTDKGWFSLPREEVVRQVKGWSHLSREELEKLGKSGEASGSLRFC